MELPPFLKNFYKQKDEISCLKWPVCHLKCPLYGSHQGAKEWYNKNERILTKVMGFTASNADPCVFLKFIGKTYIVLGVAMDDFSIVADTAATLRGFIKEYSGRI